MFWNKDTAPSPNSLQVYPQSSFIKLRRPRLGEYAYPLTATGSALEHPDFSLLSVITESIYA
jgi:hypothetical protein